MLSKPSECAGCPLEVIGQGWSELEGSGALGVMVVAEALGEWEMKEGLPLRPQAPAGSVFSRILRRAAIDRNQLSITNCARCRPPMNLLEHQPYEFESINHCQVHMDRAVKVMKPKVMLALGNVALRTLTGYTGKKKQITNVRGFVLDGLRYPDIPVISTYHPSYIQRDKPNLIGVVKMDLLRAIALARKGGVFERPKKRYQLFPNISEAERWFEELKLHPEWLNVFDIETEESFTGTDESELKGRADGSVVTTRVWEELADAPDYVIEDKVREGEIEEEDLEEVEEKPHTAITQIQFSVKGDYDAIVIPWEGPFIDLARRVLALPNEKMGHNVRLFDRPVLQAHQTKIEGVLHDSMDMWHVLQPDLPRGLQYVISFYEPTALPWKHLSQSDPGEYGGDDVSYLRKHGPKLMEDLKARGVWDCYERHVRKMGELVMDRASERGIPVDDRARVELGEEIEKDLGIVDEEVQGAVPDELRNCEPKKGYSNPKVAAKMMEKNGLEAGERWSLRIFEVPYKPPKPPKPPKVKKARKRKKGEQDVLLESNGDQLGGAGDGNNAGGEAPLEQSCAGDPDARCGGGSIAVIDGVSENQPRLVQEERWCRLQPFLPGSPKQLIRYIEWRKEEEVKHRMGKGQPRPMAERLALYQVPIDRKKKRPTTAKRELERLGKKTKDSLFANVTLIRELKKMKSTYVDGWKPGSDGRVHTQFKFAPATGQKSSSGPNVQNAPKVGHGGGSSGRFHGLATKFRNIIIAPPEFRLIEFDYRAYHALTLGFEARCPEYMRLSRLDVHSYLAGHVLKLPGREKWLLLPDEELREILKRIKKEHKQLRDAKIKAVTHGVGFGETYRSVYALNEENFENIGEVKKIDDLLRGEFPAIFRWQEAVVEEADNTIRLANRFGRERWFFEAKIWSPKTGRREWGRDARAAIAFRPSSNAFGMKDDVMLKLAGEGGGEDYMEKFGFINDLHDALMFLCPSRHDEECLHVVKREMEAPSLKMIDPIVAPGGLWCEVEAMVGSRWGGMEEVKVA